LARRPFSTEERTQARLACPQLLSPAELVRYGPGFRVSWPGSSFSWTDRNDRVVVGNAFKAVMSVPVRTHMERDGVNSLSKKAFLMSMVMDVPTAGHYVTVLNIVETHHANFLRWLAHGLAQLTLCYLAQHDRRLLCCRCDAFIARRNGLMGDAVASLHRSAPRAWGLEEYRDALSSTGGGTSHAGRLRAVLRAAPYQWVSCGSRTIVDHPADKACAGCPPHRKFRCVCGAAVPSHQCWRSLMSSFGHTKVGGPLSGMGALTEYSAWPLRFHFEHSLRRSPSCKRMGAPVS